MISGNLFSLFVPLTDDAFFATLTFFTFFTFFLPASSTDSLLSSLFSSFGSLLFSESTDLIEDKVDWIVDSLFSDADALTSWSDGGNLLAWLSWFLTDRFNGGLADVGLISSAGLWKSNDAKQFILRLISSTGTLWKSVLQLPSLIWTVSVGTLK